MWPADGAPVPDHAVALRWREDAQHVAELQAVLPLELAGLDVAGYRQLAAQQEAGMARDGVSRNIQSVLFQHSFFNQHVRTRYIHLNLDAVVCFALETLCVHVRLFCQDDSQFLKCSYGSPLFSFSL